MPFPPFDATVFPWMSTSVSEAEVEEKEMPPEPLSWIVLAAITGSDPSVASMPHWLL